LKIVLPIAGWRKPLHVAYVQLMSARTVS
jgi:hypothetical protein